MQNTDPHVYAFEGITPVIDPSAYVHPTAVLLGDVIIGPGCYVGPGAVLRGDFGRIVMEPDSNLQDNCVVHSGPGMDCLISERAHIGHGAILHFCTIGRDALVGMQADVMDRAVVGEQAIVAGRKGDRQTFEWWLEVCRALDRRMARAIVSPVTSSAG